MSGWTALNVEPEDTVADEVDDTKEIQLEEAFKSYQNALKLHSQGPSYFEAARDAYDELFRSEVFKYAEAASEFDTGEADDIVPPSAILPSEQDPILVAARAAETSANSLPQLVYLACKNRAQFAIDLARSKSKEHTLTRLNALRHYSQACQTSLVDCARALERDDTDLDLWKKAARVSDALLTHRIARFCLESVLAGDDDGEQSIDLSGLDEAFAKGELDELLVTLQDDLSQARSDNVQPKGALLKILSKSNDPFPYLPHRERVLEYIQEKARPTAAPVVHTEILLPVCSQLALADAILKAFTDYEESTANHGTAASSVIRLPPGLLKKGVATNSETTVTQEGRTQFDEAGPERADTPASAATFHSAAADVQDLRDDREEVSPVVVTSEESETRKDSRVESNQIAVVSALMNSSNRKRSSTAAGNEEPEARTKSRRIRERTSLLLEQAAQEEDHAQESAVMYREQLAAIEDADDSMLQIVDDLLGRVGSTLIGSGDRFRKIFWPPVDDSDTITVSTVTPREEATEQRQQLLRDFRTALLSWNDEKSNAATLGQGHRELEKSAGLSLFLKHSKATMSKEHVPTAAEDQDDVLSFLRWFNHNPTSIHDAVFVWLLALLTVESRSAKESPYLRAAWSSDFKQIVVRLLIKADECLVESFQQRSPPFGTSESRGTSSSDHPHLSTEQAAEFAQSVFELHLDIYSEITNPASTVDKTTRKSQMYRLERWALISTNSVRNHLETREGLPPDDPLVLRFLWASVSLAKQSEDVDKDHVLLCLQDLLSLLRRRASPVLALPNNVVMPHISVAAVEQEISRISTLDFFLSVFDSSDNDPLAVIMKLEPILEPNSISSDNNETGSNADVAQILEFRSFLNAGDVALALFLWKRLQNAYTTISYKPKVVSCLLRSIETIMRELLSTRHAALGDEERQVSMLRWLKEADELVAKMVPKLLQDSQAFECIDEDHLRSSMTAIVGFIRLLYGFALVDDGFRVGQIPTPSLKPASSNKLFEKCKDRFREMYVRLWTLLFVILKEMMQQMGATYVNGAEDLANYLRCVHNSLGERQYCKHNNKMFVRLVKTELLSTKLKEDYSTDIAQILYDLYQIRLTAGIGDVNHGCPPESLDKDKRTAHALVPTIVYYARRLNMRDLLKSELRSTIDKIQHALGAMKGSSALSHNRRVISAYLKSPINPQDLYKSLKGIGGLTTKPVQGDFATVASSGWFSLLGNMTLAKYKSIKRVNPTPTDDLDVAASFLRQDLEHNTSNWETWYRLAQVFDAKIEDSLIWNSTKLNDGRAELAVLERNAINAYTMAVAHGMRQPDEDEEMIKRFNDMLSEFAMRLYSSSRPPLKMEAFNTDKVVRHFSDFHTSMMSQDVSFKPMQKYALWKFAAYLLHRKITDRSRQWLCHYMLGKCLWKMYQSGDNSKARYPVTAEAVIEAFSDAIKTVPKKEKSSDPILEPHFKIVSIIHKLQERKAITPAAAVEYLRITPFAKNVVLRDGDDEQSEWEQYILDILKKLQSADKANWHHRIVARAAHIVYGSDLGERGALGARDQFTRQIFTKTMTMQVWKPEFERPGRHYVYTGRYLRFFVHLLDKLNDQANLEQVVRRIRRKTTDFTNHTGVWEETVLTYVNLLRRLGDIPEGRERALFDNISFEEFSRQSEKLEKWAHDPDTKTHHLEIMHDAIELKKLNNSLMKGPAVDELIGDTYACMYETFVSQLPPEDQAPSQLARPAPPQGTFINMTTETVPTGDDNLDRMRLNNLLSTQSDVAVASSAVSTSNPNTGGLGTSTPTNQFGTPPPDGVRFPGPSKPGRTKTITRREVQRKAEAALIKPPPIKTPTLEKRKLIIDVPPLRSSESLAGSNDDENVNGNGNDEIDMSDRETAESEGEGGSKQDSPRGSVDESLQGSVGADGDDSGGERGNDGDNEGDDEDSELSDLEEVEHSLKLKGIGGGSPTVSRLGKKRKADDDDDGGRGNLSSKLLSPRGGVDAMDVDVDFDEDDEGEDEDEGEGEDEGDTIEIQDSQEADGEGDQDGPGDTTQAEQGEEDDDEDDEEEDDDGDRDGD